MIVLVNRNSASASEIVSGALQDHDRALVVGETTFGKALVQSLYRIAGEAGLALTTARYFTPSGRMIQRPWDGTFDEYLSYSYRDQEQPREHERSAEEDRRRPQRLRRRRHRARSPHGRADRGLQPDALRPHAARPPGLRRLRPAVLGAGRHAHRGRQGSPAAWRANFTVDDAMVEDFKGFVDHRIAHADGRRGLDQGRAFIKAMIRYEIDAALFSIEDARRHLVANDPQAQYA